MRNRFTWTSVLVNVGKDPASQYRGDEEGFGYQFEARHVTECLQRGLIESPVMKHSDSLLLMETLDRIRERCGITYPADSKKRGSASLQ